MQHSEKLYKQHRYRQKKRQKLLDFDLEQHEMTACRGFRVTGKIDRGRVLGVCNMCGAQIEKYPLHLQLVEIDMKKPA